MLSDRDRLLLAPHLPLLRAAQAELSTAQRAYDEAEFARQRFDELVSELRSSVPALRRSIDRAARALAESTGAAPPPRPTLDTAAATGRPMAIAAEQQLRGLQAQLDIAVKEVSRWRARADEARLTALRAAADAL